MRMRMGFCRWKYHADDLLHSLSFFCYLHMQYTHYNRVSGEHALCLLTQTGADRAVIQSSLGSCLCKWSVPQKPLSLRGVFLLSAVDSRQVDLAKVVLTFQIAPQWNNITVSDFNLWPRGNIVSSHYSSSCLAMCSPRCIAATLSESIHPQQWDVPVAGFKEMNCYLGKHRKKKKEKKNCASAAASWHWGNPPHWLCWIFSAV